MVRPSTVRRFQSATTRCAAARIDGRASHRARRGCVCGAATTRRRLRSTACSMPAPKTTASRTPAVRWSNTQPARRRRVRAGHAAAGDVERVSPVERAGITRRSRRQARKGRSVAPAHTRARARLRSRRRQCAGPACDRPAVPGSCRQTTPPCRMDSSPASAKRSADPPGVPVGRRSARPRRARSRPARRHRERASSRVHGGLRQCAGSADRRFRTSSWMVTCWMSKRSARRSVISASTWSLGAPSSTTACAESA